jgi:hypothetical protein
MKNIFMITVRMNNFRLKNYEPYKTYKVLRMSWMSSCMS